MKIVIIGTVHPYRGGLAAFNERLAEEFRREGEDVRIGTFTLQYPDILFPGKTQYTDAAAPKDLRIERRINSCNPFNWLKVGKAIAAEQPDLLIFSYWMAFFAPCFSVIARMAKKNGKTRCVALVHNMIPHEPNLLDKILPPVFVRSMDAFVALSKSVVRDIATFDKHDKPKYFSPHPIYDHYGMRKERANALSALGLDVSSRYVLFFGFIRAYKGLDLLLNAFADKRLRELDVRLIVAGEFYESPDSYMSVVKENGLAERVHFFSEFIPDAQVADFFSAADIVAQPYRTATQSGVTQIAYHFERPMLVTNVGGLPEIVPDGKVGYVVPPDSKAIADALVDYFEQGREAEFSPHIKTEKEKYAWSKMTATIKEAIRE